MIMFIKAPLRQFAIIIFLIFETSTQLAQGQTNHCPTCWVPITRHRLVPNVNISNHIKGYAEFLPISYSQNPNKKYPLIVFVHGVGQVGDGLTEASLCNSVCGSLPLKIEEYHFSDVVYNNSGQAFSYIVLSPQYNQWPGTDPTDVQGFINYAIANYRVDINRIYLTGISSGSDLIMNYMSSSASEANRIAAVVPLAVCNSSNSSGAYDIGSQKIRFWGIHCANDNTCGSGNTVNWSNAINSYSPQGNPMGQYTLTPVYNPSFPHDIFYATYDSGWKENNKNITQWMIQYSKTANGSLPATLGNYEVGIKNKEVVAEWTSTYESNTDYFIIERAEADMQFRPIGKVKAAGNSSNPLSYSFKDQQPLKGNSFYRLSLVNKDGLQEYYDIKKISIRLFGFMVSLNPVPATKTLHISFELEEAGKLNFVIRDINGRSIQHWSANFTSGYANLPLNIESFAPGVYYLNVQGAHFNEAKKFIRQ